MSVPVTLACGPENARRGIRQACWGPTPDLAIGRRTTFGACDAWPLVAQRLGATTWQARRCSEAEARVARRTYYSESDA
jgi:hypothetical protein